MKIFMDKFEEALIDSGGIVTTLANRIGVSRKALYEWLVKNPHAQELLKSERESLIDLAESKLLIKLNDGEDWAIKYVLATMGRFRGWSEKPEINTQVNVLAQTTNNNLTIQNIRELLKKNEELWNRE